MLLALVLAQALGNPLGPIYSQPSLMSRAAALCDAVQAGDKAGAWECMKGDGTMLSGSATTFVATGSPTNSTENGWPVRTYTAAQNDQQPAAAAFPASDFTVCKHHRSTALVSGELAAFGNFSSAANTVVLPFEQTATSGNLTPLVSNGTAFSVAPSRAITAGSWNLLCFTYLRTGGAADNVGTLYVNGVSAGSSSTMKLAQAFATKWSTNGQADSGGGATASSTRGFFVTYKALSADDVARIYARLAP